MAYNSPSYHIIEYLIDQRVAVHVYSGNRDTVVPHTGTELTLANTTWGGKQGFQKPMDSMYFDADGKQAGTFGIERGLSYHLFFDAPHQVAQVQPAASLQWLKEFILKPDLNWQYEVEHEGTP